MEDFNIICVGKNMMVSELLTESGLFPNISVSQDALKYLTEDAINDLITNAKKVMLFGNREAYLEAAQEAHDEGEHFDDCPICAQERDRAEYHREALAEAALDNPDFGRVEGRDPSDWGDAEPLDNPDYGELVDAEFEPTEDMTEEEEEEVWKDLGLDGELDPGMK